MQGLRLNGHPEDWDPRVSGDHSGQVRSPARAGDDHADSTTRGLACKFRGRIRRAMRGQDMRFVRDSELVEDFNGVAHRFPIRFAPHNDGHE